jgi:hypothetical protein
LDAQHVLSLSLTTIDQKLFVSKIADNHSPFCCCATGFVLNDRVMARRSAETELVSIEDYEFLQANKFVLTCMSNDFNSGSSKTLFNNCFWCVGSIPALIATAKEEFLMKEVRVAFFNCLGGVISRLA